MIYTGNSSPTALAAIIMDVNDLEEFITRSGYVQPRFIMIFFLPGSSLRFVSI